RSRGCEPRPQAPHLAPPQDASGGAPRERGCGGYSHKIGNTSRRPEKFSAQRVTANDTLWLQPERARGTRLSDQPDGAESKTAKPAAENRGWRVVDFSQLQNPPAAFAA